MDLITTRAMLADAKALVAKLEAEEQAAVIAELPAEPDFPTHGVPRVITFKKRFGAYSGKFYNYAAIAPRHNCWYLTGRKPSDPITGRTWDQLLDFIVSEETMASRKLVLESFEVIK